MKYSVSFGIRKRAESSAEMKTSYEDTSPTGLFVLGDTGSRFPNMPRRDSHPVRKIAETTNIPIVKRDPDSAPCSPSSERPFVASLSSVFSDYHLVPSYYLNHHLLQREQASNTVGPETRGRSHTVSGRLTGIPSPETGTLSPVQGQDSTNASFQSRSVNLGADRNLGQLEKTPFLSFQTPDKQAGRFDVSGGIPYEPSDENLVLPQRAQTSPLAFRGYSDEVAGAGRAMSTPQHEAIFNKECHLQKVDTLRYRQPSVPAPRMKIESPLQPRTPRSQSTFSHSNTSHINSGVALPKSGWDDRYINEESLRRRHSLRRLPVEFQTPKSPLKTPPPQFGIPGKLHVGRPPARLVPFSKPRVVIDRDELKVAGGYSSSFRRPFSTSNATEAGSPSRASHRRGQEIRRGPNRNAMITTQFEPATTLSDTESRERGGADLTDAVVSVLFAGTAPGEEGSDEDDNMADDEASARPTRNVSVYQRRNSGNRSRKPPQHQEVGRGEQISNPFRSKTYSGPAEGIVDHLWI